MDLSGNNISEEKFEKEFDEIQNSLSQNITKLKIKLNFVILNLDLKKMN